MTFIKITNLTYLKNKCMERQFCKSENTLMYLETILNINSQKPSYLHQITQFRTFKG